MTLESLPPQARRRRRSRVVPVLPAAVLALIVLLALLAPVLGLESPTASTLAERLQPPAWAAGGSSEHLLGTDHLGRDVLSRVIYGARASLTVAVLVVLISAVVGTTVGLVSGFHGGTLDNALMRFVDIVLSLPLVLLAIVAAVALGASATGLVIILASILWAEYARIVRGETLSLRQRDFTLAAITLGYRHSRIIGRHILPNLLHTVVVVATLQIGTVILMEASLSFLGVGIPPPTPTWGRMISDGRAYIADGWWVPVFAGCALAAVIVCANLLGDWLRDRLDPQQSGRQRRHVL